MDGEISGVRTLLLSKDYEAIVDEVDYAEVSQFKWTASVRKNGKVYAVRRKRMDDGRVKLVYLHREIMGNPSSRVDHKNGDGLDNRRNNLRLATHPQNLWNIGKPSHGRTSRFKGVHRHSQTGRWTSQIRVNNKVIHLGCFDTEEEAAAAYRKAAETHHGEFARIN